MSEVFLTDSTGTSNVNEIICLTQLGQEMQ